MGRPHPVAILPRDFEARAIEAHLTQRDPVERGALRPVADRRFDTDHRDRQRPICATRRQVRTEDEGPNAFWHFYARSIAVCSRTYSPRTRGSAPIAVNVTCRRMDGSVRP